MKPIKHISENGNEKILSHFSLINLIFLPAILLHRISEIVNRLSLS